MRDKIIRENREGTLEQIYEDNAIRRLIKIEKVLKILFLSPIALLMITFAVMIAWGILGWMLGWTI